MASRRDRGPDPRPHRRSLLPQPAPAALPDSGGRSALRRREFLAYFSSVGLSGTLLPGVLLGMTQEQPVVTPDMIAAAEQLAGLSFDDEQRAMMARGLNQRLQSYERVRAVPLSNAVPPAFLFDPLPAGYSRPAGGERRPLRYRRTSGLEVPGDLEELAFWPVIHLAELVRSQAVTSVELTEMYLGRLRHYDEKLHCVITLTEELAMQQAEQADAEIADGHYRGPLHGIPWGAKDLLNTRGIRTTYGARCFENQVLDDDATVVERLRNAGAVLIAKLSLGALAMGDVWFGETTRNPWNFEQGSSGSSAGSASATVAGLVGFAIGTETLGSIVSPCSRCGATGLRPTYGRVSRAGAMALSWTMDKIGPIARCVEDCAVILQALHGPDPGDPSVPDVGYEWDPDRSLGEVRVGYLQDQFESRRTSDADRVVLEVLRRLGVKLRPVSLPELPAGDLITILNAEAATAFDDITRSGEVDQLVRQDPGAWPNSFRTARMIPAVEYLRASRVRTLLIEQMARATADVDVFVAPAFGGSTLMTTNLTGHPAVVLPCGFREDGTPTSITFIGSLYGESKLCTVARAYQDATDFHRRTPDLDRSS